MGNLVVLFSCLGLAVVQLQWKVSGKEDYSSPHSPPPSFNCIRRANMLNAVIRLDSYCSWLQKSTAIKKHLLQILPQKSSFLHGIMYGISTHIHKVKNWFLSKGMEAFCFRENMKNFILSSVSALKSPLP